MAVATTPSTRRYAKKDWTDFAHTGPDTLAGRYLRMFWQPVYLGRDLAPGRAVPIRIMSEDFTLYRGEGLGPHPARLPSQAAPASPIAMGEGDQRAPSPAAAGEGGGEGGKAHLLAFRCAHRGTQLSTGWVEGDDLRCFYHGWKYDSSGQCIEQPAEPEPFCQKIRIRSYPTEEYLGFIFAYLGEGEPPPMPRFPDFEGTDGVREEWGGPIVPCNYFNRLDNDPVHPAFVHRQHGSRIPFLEAEETEYGFRYFTKYPDGFEGVAYRYMPNITHFSSPPQAEGLARTQGLAWRVPVDDGHYTSFRLALVPVTGEAAERYRQRPRPGKRGNDRDAAELAAAVLAGRMPTVELESLPNAVEVQDWVSLVGQGVIADRDNEHLGREDLTVILFRKLWERELARLATGRPLTQWRRPDRLVANSE